LIVKNFNIPAIIVASEGVFSRAGNITANKRSVSSSKVINQLIFLSENKNIGDLILVL